MYVTTTCKAHFFFWGGELFLCHLHLQSSWICLPMTSMRQRRGCCDAMWWLNGPVSELPNSACGGCRFWCRNELNFNTVTTTNEAAFLNIPSVTLIPAPDQTIEPLRGLKQTNIPRQQHLLRPFPAGWRIKLSWLRCSTCTFTPGVVEGLAGEMMTASARPGCISDCFWAAWMLAHCCLLRSFL